MMMKASSGNEFLSLCESTLKVNTSRFRRDLAVFKHSAKKRGVLKAEKADTFGNWKVDTVAKKGRKKRPRKRKQSETNADSAHSLATKRLKSSKCLSANEVAIAKAKAATERGIAIRRKFGIYVFPDTDTVALPCDTWSKMQLFANAHSIRQLVFENLKRKGMGSPLPIQMQCVPILCEAHDLQCCAPTGSGKTLAFALPMLSRIVARHFDIGAADIAQNESGSEQREEQSPEELMADAFIEEKTAESSSSNVGIGSVVNLSGEAQAMGLVVAPTTVLCAQILFDFRLVTRGTDLKCLCVDHLLQPLVAAIQVEMEYLNSADFEEEEEEDCERNADETTAAFLDDDSEANEEEVGSEKSTSDDCDKMQLQQSANDPSCEKPLEELFRDASKDSDGFMDASVWNAMVAGDGDEEEDEGVHLRATADGLLPDSLLKQALEEDIVDSGDDGADKDKYKSVTAEMDDVDFEKMYRSEHKKLKKEGYITGITDAGTDEFWHGFSDKKKEKKKKLPNLDESVNDWLDCEGTVGRVITLLKRRGTMQSLASSHVLIGTPSVMAFLIRNEFVDCNKVCSVVLDEADLLFDSGRDKRLLADARTVASMESLTDYQMMKQSIQRSLFSATMDDAVMSLLECMLNSPLQVSIGNGKVAALNITQSLVYCGDERGKVIELLRRLEAGLRPPVLVFCQSAARCQELKQELQRQLATGSPELMRHLATLDSSMSEAAKRQMVARFRRGDVWLLLCTDTLSRGMDFKAVATVLNFDVPQSAADYIHRIGRTARCDRKGEALTLWTDVDLCLLSFVVDIMRRGGQSVPQWLADRLPKPSDKALSTFKAKPIARGPIRRGGLYVHGTAPAKEARIGSKTHRKQSKRRRKTFKKRHNERKRRVG